MLLKNKIEIQDWLKKYGIKNYELIPDDKYGYVVNVNQNINLNHQKLKIIDVKFNKVYGWFNCSYNKLTSLKGCPEIVDGHFWCNSNKLESLKGCPKIINGDFYCNNNQLNNLESLTNLLNIEIQNNYIYLANNSELDELQNITDFNNVKNILQIYQEKKELNELIITHDDEIIKKNIIKI